MPDTQSRAPPCAVLCLFALISARTNEPRMPLMNFTVSGVSYFLAISTASLMATEFGTSRK